nr:hypothetical protein 21 [bacterium]
MATELTFDPTPADNPEFSDEELDSLRVGEEAAEQEQQLLAGKFQDAEELEKAYIELQKHLGKKDNGEELQGDEEAPEEEVEQEEEEEVSPAQSLITNASTEFFENGGLSEETMQAFNEMSSQQLVEAYMEMQAGAQPPQATPDLTQEEVNYIKNFVGGEESYENIVTWATESLSEDVINAYDQVVDTGDAGSIQLALAGLKSMYEDANGYEGRMLSGKAPQQTFQGFRSQAEVLAAMQDPRYDNDPAYRQDVFNKLEISDIQY